MTRFAPSTRGAKMPVEEATFLTGCLTLAAAMGFTSAAMGVTSTAVTSAAVGFTSVAMGVTSAAVGFTSAAMGVTSALGSADSTTLEAATSTMGLGSGLEAAGGWRRTPLSYHDATGTGGGISSAPV